MNVPDSQYESEGGTLVDMLCIALFAFGIVCLAVEMGRVTETPVAEEKIN